MGGGDHPHVHGPALGGAHFANLAFLQHPQQSGLGFGREFADFIQEQTAAVRRFNQPGAGRDGAGKGAFLVAKQF